MNLDEAAALLKLLSTKFDPTVPLRTIHVFVELAAEKERTGKVDSSYAKELGMPSNYFSRDVDTLSPRGAYGAIDAIVSTTDRRLREFVLTDKGEDAVKAIKKLKTKPKESRT